MDGFFVQVPEDEYVQMCQTLDVRKKRIEQLEQLCRDMYRCYLNTSCQECVEYDSCPSLDDVSGSHGYAVYRPVWWFTDEDKAAYIKEQGIVNSECYTRYGFTRTGCALCPFAGRNLESEKVAVAMYEPKLLKFANALFGKSYAYMEGYQAYKAERDREEDQDQLRLFA